MKLMTRLTAAAVLLCATVAFPLLTAACPFCSAPSLTLSEQTAQSDVVLLAEWKGATKGMIAGLDSPDAKDSPTAKNAEASTTFEVKKVLKGSFKPGQTIKQAGYQPADKGGLFLLTGIGADIVQWDIPTPVSEAVFKYLADAPAPVTADGGKVPYKKRLPYFAKFLEYPDPTVAGDAYSEFANAPYEDIAAVKDSLSHDKLRAWVLDPATPPSRLGLYGLLLGLSGNDGDAAAMEKLIAQPTADFRIGLDGIMSGYLLLKKEPGLDLVRKLKLENEYLVEPDGKPVLDAQGQKVPVPFSETYSAMQAVRFMWDYGGGSIAPDRLREAIRTLLSRPELADLAIADLARWKDWGVMDRLAKLYDSESYQVPGIKRSIIRYFDAATKDLPPGVKPDQADKLPEHVKEAKQYLAAIEKKDPETVKSVKQFLILTQ